MCAEREQAVEGHGSAAAPAIGDTLLPNLERISADFGNSCDLIINTIPTGASSVAFATVYLKEMTEPRAAAIVSNILGHIKNNIGKNSCDALFTQLLENLGVVRTTTIGADFKALYTQLLAGNMVLLVDGVKQYVSVNTAADEGRSITEPTSQTNIKGPKDAFTESIHKNVYLIRKRIKNEALWVEDITLGTVTHTSVKLLYISGIAKKDIVDDLRHRVMSIDYDGIIGSSYIEEIIKTDPHSIFPTSINSERPDNIVAGLLEGRVAIISDGTPYVLIAPAIFSDFLQASDDYYENHVIASLMRLIRYVALTFTLLVPSMFVALITFHQEIIPTPLLISLAAQREGGPLPGAFRGLDDGCHI